MNYVFIDVDNGISKSGFVKDGKLEDLIIENNDRSSNYQYVYRSRVLDVIPGINAAFLDIGEGKNAYLSGRDALDLEGLSLNNRANIQDLVKSGEDILVQIKKEAYGDKGAKVTRHIELTGKYIVFKPFSKEIIVSRKIKDKKRRKELFGLGERIKEDGQGMIIRSICERTTDNIIESEYKELKRIFEYIESQKNFLPTPKLIYKPLSEYEELIANNINTIDKIIINNEDKVKSVFNNLKNMDLDISRKIIFDSAYSTKYDSLVNWEIMESLKSNVSLKGGASIMIEKTEAMTIIDVNTDSFIGDLSKEETVMKTNIEAAKKIAREIKLRNISGIIMIDFINMKRKKDKNKLINLLKKELNEDTVGFNIMGMTRLGILEMTRERTRKSIEDVLMVECDSCQGRGKMIKI